MKTPEWRRKDKAGSLKAWVDMLNDVARKQFLEAGTHVELFFVFNEDGLMEVIPIAGMEKDEVVSALKAMLVARNGYAFIHIVEATARMIDSADAADLLLIHAESRSGFSEAYMSTVAMRGEEKMLLDAVKVDGKKLGGRYANIFERL